MKFNRIAAIAAGAVVAVFHLGAYAADNLKPVKALAPQVRHFAHLSY